jgi:hypothetical protein
MVASTAGRSGAADGERPEARTKPPELEDFLNRRLFHPLSRRLAVVLVPTFVTPNMLSLSGALLVLSAGVLYSFVSTPMAIATGFAMHLMWHVVDGADGDLARMTGRASPFGEAIDGACDYLSHAVLYLMLATFLDDQIGLWAYPLALASGCSRVAQANHAETQRRIYLWRAYGVPWMQQARTSDGDLFPRERGGTGILARLTRAYMWLADLLTPASADLDRATREAARDPVARRRLSRLCRCASRTALSLQLLLGANWRTVALGASMALGTPLWFFLLETTALNLLLVVSVRRQKACNEALGARLAA